MLQWACLSPGQGVPEVMIKKFLEKSEPPGSWTPAHTRQLWRRVVSITGISIVFTVVLVTLAFGYIIWQAIVINILIAVPFSYIIYRRFMRYQIIVEKQNKDLQELNAGLNAFAHTVAHDLKNPMHIITGYMQLLEEGELTEPEELQMAYQMISDSANLAHQIVEDLLLLAHASADVEFSSLPMDKVVEHAWERQGWLTDKHKATLQQPAEWPAVRSYAPWVEAVWSNLLSNAIKYGGKPPIVSVGCDRLADDTLRFWVKDNGPGISADQQSRLFTEFSRLGQSNSEGHGLGLWIVKRIVERLGGEVGVESEAGAGSTFWFTLPENSEEPAPEQV